MAKRNLLGARFALVSIGSGPAYDVSGDVGAVDTAESMIALEDVTGLDVSAHERIAMLGDGTLQWSAYWNNVIAGRGGEHAILKSLIGTPVRGLFTGSATEGDGLAFCVSGILDDYKVTRAPTGAGSVKPKVTSYNGDLPDWGFLAASGTDASGTVNHAAIDNGVPGGPALTITAISQANPTHVTITAHGLVTGDSINVTGSNGTPGINGDWPVTVLDANTFTVPVNQTVAGTTGTAIKTSQNFGVVLVSFLFSIGSGTNYALSVRHSADNGVADAYAALTTPVSSGSLTAAGAESRVHSVAQNVKRWMLVQATGTYTSAVVMALLNRRDGVA